jgi:hypothetical protein
VVPARRPWGLGACAVVGAVDCANASGTSHSNQAPIAIPRSARASQRSVRISDGGNDTNFPLQASLLSCNVERRPARQRAASLKRSDRSSPDGRLLPNSARRAAAPARMVATIEPLPAPSRLPRFRPGARAELGFRVAC